MLNLFQEQNVKKTIITRELKMNLNQTSTNGSLDINNIASFASLSDAEKLSTILNADKLQLNSLIALLETNNSSIDLLTLAKKISSLDGVSNMIGGGLN
jgi:hypothetical protein